MQKCVIGTGEERAIKISQNMTRFRGGEGVLYFPENGKNYVLYERPLIGATT